MEGERELNFGDIVIEILAQNASFSPKRERERKKGIVAMELLKL